MRDRLPVFILALCAGSTLLANENAMHMDVPHVHGVAHAQIAVAAICPLRFFMHGYIAAQID